MDHENDGVRTRRIGNATWTVMHAFPYSMHDFASRSAIVRYITMVDLLLDTYPCEICRTHIQTTRELKALRDELRATMDTEWCDRECQINAVVLWAFRFHNEVSRQLGKPESEFMRLEAELQASEDRVRMQEKILRLLDVTYNVVYDIHRFD